MRRSASRPYVDRWLGLSLAGHLALGLVLLSVKFSGSTPSFLVAAGPGGEGGGSGSAIEVGLVQDWELAKFFPASPTGALTEEPHLSTARIEQVQRPDDQPELLLPGHEQRRPDPRTVVTERPVIQGPRPYTGRQEIGGSPHPSAVVGPTLPVSTSGGVGLGEGFGLGGTGIPGGSDYGRRLQQALSSYYRFAPVTGLGQRFVIVRVRIARNGRILSIVNGRLDPGAFITRSGNPIVDTRVEAALLELDRNPIPFPPDFLPGAREAIAEIYFQY
jgi:hypothetical protein